MDYKKTRIAPTPSGFLHVGNILSFSLTAALAQKSGARVLLRIDDLDRERVNAAYLGDIFDTLHFLGIPWDEGPADVASFEAQWSQLIRMELYNKALRVLRDSGAVFACDCSRAQLLRSGAEGVYPGTCRDRGLSLDAPNVNWRLRTPPEVGLPPEMRDFVVRKKDGFPAYQLTSLVDDLHFGVDLIVRGEDLRPSTLAQLWLAEVLSAATLRDGASGQGVFGRNEFRNTRFYHHPLLVTAAGEKLSKSAGATSIHYLRQQGFTPADVYQHIARLLGFAEPVRDWEQLATLVFARGYGVEG